jgi:YgiT-type zinc finger domain-containing protein
MDEQSLNAHSVEMNHEISQWRKAHPRASYQEIEDEVHGQLMQLEAYILKRAAEESPSREWGRHSENEAPPCPHCGKPLSAKGQAPRTLQGNGGESVTLKRTYGVCSSCGMSLFSPR